MNDATPSPQTAQIQEWMADLDALIKRVEASRDLPYRGGDLADCRASALMALQSARRWLIADLGHQRKEATEVSPHPRPTLFPTPDPPAGPTNEEIIKAARQYDCDHHALGPVFEAFANGARWARVMQRMLQTGDKGFIRADHKHEDPTCDHAAYLALPEPRPRHCPTCGTCMWDAGD